MNNIKKLLIKHGENFSAESRVVFMGQLGHQYHLLRKNAATVD